MERMLASATMNRFTPMIARYNLLAARKEALVTAAGGETCHVPLLYSHDCSIFLCLYSWMYILLDFKSISY